jgi:hypothetical protein
MSRFKATVFISDGLGPTLASADCPATFSTGNFEGYWDFKCALAAPDPKGVDESVRSAAEQSYAIKYVKHHLDRLLPVTLAKLGRGFGFFRPFQQIDLDALIEGRPHRWALVGLYSYYGLLALSVAGFVVVVRRRVTSIPLLAVTGAVIVTIAISFGQTRYRTPFEVVLAILAAVAVDGLCNVLRRSNRSGGAPLVAPGGTPDMAGPVDR